MDLRLMFIVLCLMSISLLAISSVTQDGMQDKFLTPYVKSQIEWFALGGLVYLFFVGFDYHYFLSFSWLLYIFILFLLCGLFLTTPIQNVHRWYKIPILNVGIQPSEYAKIILVLFLGWFLEKNKGRIASPLTAFQIACLVGIPFLLILKQPDLGTALVLYPIALVMCYFAKVHTFFLKIGSSIGLILLIIVGLFFTGTLDHEKMKPYFTTVLHEYQYERLNPKTYHQKAAIISVATGGVTGSGWNKSEFAGRHWLPAAHTDSIFAVYAEQFGLLGVVILLFLFFCLIYLSLNVISTAKDSYGRLLAAGITAYFTMHILVNVSMMCGFLPIAGVPLLMVSYGGTSVVTTMSAIGLLQSIYTRRFMF
jgi:rod shape determining protein RodA